MLSLRKYFTRERIKAFIPKFLFCILGNFLIGFGVAAIKVADCGIDPFNGSCFAVSEFFHIEYTWYVLGFNCFLFIFEIIFGRRHIGIGTFVNWFCVCYSVDFGLWVFSGVMQTVAGNYVWRGLFLAGGLAVTCLGIAIYQLCDAGIAPFDVLPVMICDRHPKFPFFWARMIFDCFCVALIFVFRGKFGIGTILTAFCLGPVIHFFTFLIERFILKKPKKAETAVPVTETARQ